MRSVRALHAKRTSRGFPRAPTQVRPRLGGGAGTVTDGKLNAAPINTAPITLDITAIPPPQTAPVQLGSPGASGSNTASSPRSGQAAEGHAKRGHATQEGTPAENKTSMPVADAKQGLICLGITDWPI